LFDYSWKSKHIDDEDDDDKNNNNKLVMRIFESK
jgi:hypothetical protein